MTAVGPHWSYLLVSRIKSKKKVSALNSTSRKPKSKRSTSSDSTRLWARSADKPLISVFGSSRSVRGDELYEEAYRLGKLLGQNGFNVATGGYTGVMEAVSRGAHEHGAHVVGVTMRQFEDEVNPFVMDEISTGDFYQRLRWLVDRSQG